MKNLITLLLLLFLANPFYGQNFNLTISIDTVYLSSYLQTEHCYAYLNNETASPIEVDIIRVVNDAPPNWANGMCADSVCYFTSQDSIRVIIPPNDNVEFRPGFVLFDDTTTAIAHSAFEMKNKTDPSQPSLTHSFYAINENTLSSNENISLDQAIHVFPNPTTDIIKIETDIPIDRIRFFNAEGKLIFEQMSLDKNLNLSFYPKGIYYLELNSSSGKAVKKIIKH